MRRCFYIDDISGERYPGLASNYLCNAEPGDPIQIAGPYGSRFFVPDDSKANLMMIGVGTGIAPFRAFVKHIYEVRGGWEGEVRLFYGAKTGMELLYMNDVRKDLSLYYDEKSFKAFEAVSPRPHFDAPPDLEKLLRGEFARGLGPGAEARYLCVRGRAFRCGNELQEGDDCGRRVGRGVAKPVRRAGAGRPVL